MGLAELRAKYGQKSATPAPAAAVAAPAPVAAEVEETDEEEVAEEAPAPVQVVTPPPAARAPRTRKAPPAAPPGGNSPEDTINPPEAKAALAAIRSEVAAANDPAPKLLGFTAALGEFTTEQLRDELRLRGYSVYLSSGAEVVS